MNNYSFISAIQQTNLDSFHLVYHSHPFQNSGYSNYLVTIAQRCRSFSVFDQFGPTSWLVVVGCFDALDSKFNIHWTDYLGAIPSGFNQNQLQITGLSPSLITELIVVQRDATYFYLAGVFDEIHYFETRLSLTYNSSEKGIVTIKTIELESDPLSLLQDL